ncbi:MAG: hypothetical protein QM778_25005 [Myxococcales bacterium]
MHRYRVYGLTIEADSELTELLPLASPGEGDVSAEPPEIDVRIRVAPAQSASQAANEPGSWAQRLGPNTIVSQFENTARFVVLSGRDVLVEPCAGADPDLVRHLLLGPVFAQVLWQRSKFVLHGCVLRVGSRQLGFIGMSGAGKSTLAIALHEAGHTLVCDDVAALEWSASPVLVHPALPRMRAFADTLEQLGVPSAGLARAHRDLPKWLLPAQRFADTALPLDRVYVLSAGERCEVAPLSRAEAMLELLRNTYYAEQYVGLFGPQTHMELAGALANGLSVQRLARPREWARLPELVRFIERECA